jgi:proline dehydrogenase
MLRSTLLYLSGHRRLRRFMETSPLAQRLTTRFVAGPRLEDAVAVCARLQGGGILIALDRLGENVTTLREAEASRDGYLEALDRIAALGFESSVSIKLTQFGLDLSEQACRDNVERLVRQAAALGKRVEIDMESSEYVERTLSLATEMHEAHGNVRAVVQAYLYRTEKDVEELCRRRVPVRLCKGAYREPPEIAYQRKRDVDRNYRRLMKVLLDRGNYPGLATHDEAIIEDAKRYAYERGIGRERFEFQMLYGIRRDLERRFVRQGYRLRLYVPYGEAWYPYFMRRLAERPANLLFLLRNFMRG